MNKAQLVEIIAQKVKISKSDAKKAIDVFIDINKPKNNRRVVNKVDSKSSFKELSDLLHPMINKVSIKLFHDEYYKESVYAAIVEVVSRVKKNYKGKTKKTDDGTSLMMKAFNQENPVIRLFNEDEDDWKGMQEGYKYIFAGMVLAIRNPKAHGNFKIQELDAIELLLFSSRLMRKLDNEIVPT